MFKYIEKDLTRYELSQLHKKYKKMNATIKIFKKEKNEKHT